MRTVYYSLMLKFAIVFAFAAILTCGARFVEAQQTLLKTASLESHEGLTISVQPWTDPAQYKEKFPKKSPMSGGVVAIQVSLRNDSDDSVKVNLSRIRLNVALSEDNRQGLRALNPEEVADRVLHPVPKDPTTPRAKLPIPIGRSNNPHDKHWTALQKAAGEAALPGSVVAPHKTLQGLLYFDIEGQFDLLNAAHLYVPDAVALESNRALTYFEIDLSRRGN
jgi:hypothetical protein